MAYQNRSHRHSGRRRAPRRFFILLLLTALCAGFLYWSNRSLQVERFTYASPRLPAGFDGCRVVQLSDLHGASFGEDNRDLLDAVRVEKPDYIFLTGDLLDRHRGTDPAYAANLVEQLSAVAPVYFVTGNHEWALPDVRGLKRELRDAGATVLTNEAVPLERNGDTILLAGIDDPNGFADQKTPEALAEEVRASWDGFWLLLAHRNDRFEGQYSKLGADLVLSGHGHGGVFRLPFTDGLLGTNRNLFPSYTAGFYEVDGRDLFVSRGLGNSGRSFRVFNRPEVAVVTFERG